MKNRLRLEVDANSHLKLPLVEFHDYFLSTQLELPLIMEDLDGNLVSTLLTYGKRIDRYRWCYSTVRTGPTTSTSTPGCAALQNTSLKYAMQPEVTG